MERAWIRNVLMAISGGVGRDMKGLLWELPPAGVSMAVRLARLPDLETRLPMMLEGRLLEDMVDCRRKGWIFGCCCYVD